MVNHVDEFLVTSEDNIRGQILLRSTLDSNKNPDDYELHVRSKYGLSLVDLQMIALHLMGVDVWFRSCVDNHSDPDQRDTSYWLPKTNQDNVTILRQNAEHTDIGQLLSLGLRGNLTMGDYGRLNELVDEHINEHSNLHRSTMVHLAPRIFMLGVLVDITRLKLEPIVNPTDQDTAVIETWRAGLDLYKAFDELLITPIDLDDLLKLSRQSIIDGIVS